MGYHNRQHWTFRPGSRMTAAMEPLDLTRVIVRPIRADERGDWDALMRAHHDLGFDRTSGRALRQVAEIDGRGWAGRRRR
jgi:hypothetical protein